jgi:hypothetical protein
MSKDMSTGIGPEREQIAGWLNSKEAAQYWFIASSVRYDPDVTGEFVSDDTFTGPFFDGADLLVMNDRPGLDWP